MGKRLAVAGALLAMTAAGANAQTATSETKTALSASSAQASSSSGTPIATRVATTTFSGDTGLWFVPTAEVLPAKKWSASFYRRGTNFAQGFTNVGDFAGTFAVGIRDRAEIFGSFLVITRVDRDLRPLFVANPAEGGVVDRYPYMNTTWSGNQLGDLLVGAKFNLFSQWQQRPMAVAVRGIVKIPTGDDAGGASTGGATGGGATGA